jgi:hypothetical protein
MNNLFKILKSYIMNQLIMFLIKFLIIMKKNLIMIAVNNYQKFQVQLNNQ